MNREIKFRAYADGEIIYSHNNILNSDEFQLSWFFQKLDGLKPFLAGPAIIMQYTGLKDKNGVEIYEGDILCSDLYSDWEWRGVVKFSHGVFGAEWMRNEKNQSMVGSWGQKHNLRKLDDDIINGLILVGNIFNNPDLLIEK